MNASDITPLQQRFGMPIEFSEVGYRSLSGARFEPFNFLWSGEADMAEQANLYEALFSYWNDHGFMQGVQLWDWKTDPAAGGSGDTDFTPQNKSAEEVMRRWFGGSGTPTLPVSGAFTTAGSARPSQVHPGQPTTITTRVVAPDTGASDTIVDIEVYDASGGRVHQQFYEGQSFAGGETKEYLVSWTPSQDGAYAVATGIFTKQWTTNLHWNSGMATITVAGSTPPPEQPGESTLEVWWPVDGGTVSGVQPMKAILTNHSVDAYQMFWQVDGGERNLMPTSHEEYPHKEVLVDVGPWQWRASGPYAIESLAADNSGRIMGQKQLNIFVAR